MSNTYLVTGGAGFIGSHIAASLLRDGQKVRVIDNLLTGSRKNLDYLQALGGDLQLTIGDINDGDLLRRLMRGVDFVLHQAALPS
ncbi:MAG: NAD-dependent epimerase/dehydratase family protein, partial [Chloroflexi bacterium]|nr:NAD-dependent epimerase/dehydratase family protein [Chloroflexota bacterium]